MAEAAEVVQTAGVVITVETVEAEEVSLGERQAVADKGSVVQNIQISHQSLKVQTEGGAIFLLLQRSNALHNLGCLLDFALPELVELQVGGGDRLVYVLFPLRQDLGPGLQSGAGSAFIIEVTIRTTRRLFCNSSIS